jgi:hypothetical protein
VPFKGSDVPVAQRHQPNATRRGTRRVSQRLARWLGPFVSPPPLTSGSRACAQPGSLEYDTGRDPASLTPLIPILTRHACTCSGSPDHCSAHTERESARLFSGPCSALKSLLCHGIALLHHSKWPLLLPHRPPTHTPHPPTREPRLSRLLLTLSLARQLLAGPLTPLFLA